MDYTNFNEVIAYLGKVNRAVYGANPFDQEGDEKYGTHLSPEDDIFCPAENEMSETEWVRQEQGSHLHPR